MRKSLRALGVLLLFLFLVTSQTLQAQGCGNFYDGFEAGSLGPSWTIGTGTYTRTVSTVNPAVGTYNFEQSCATSNSFYQGTYATFTPAQPTYLSFWMRTNTTNAANGYVVIGNSNIASDNGILFCYFNATSGLRFFNTTGYNHPISANTWYHVEARNVNWTTRTMDIWVNGVQILPGWAFRSPSATNMDRVHLFSLSASVAQYDDIQIGIPGVVIDSFQSLSPVCFGDSTGSIDLTASSPNGGLAYAWSTGDSTQDIMNLSAGSYTVSITDSLGCLLVDSISVSDPGQITPTAVATDLLCPGDANGTLDVTVAGGSPGYTFLWSTGDTTEDVNGLMGGSYSVTVTDANGCEGNNSFTITEPAPWGSSVAISSPSCEGGSDGTINYTLSGANGGYTYLWSNGDSTGVLSGLPAGTYTLLATDSLGCNYQDSVVLSDPPGVNPNATIASPTCFSFGNGSITLNPSGGTPVYTYLWSTSASSQNLPSATAGTYIVTITDANGCISIDSFLVTEPAAIQAAANITPSTGTPNGAIDLTVTGGTPPFTYAWSNSATTQDISGLDDGTYIVTITDDNGCVGTDTFIVDEIIAVENGMGTSLVAWPNPFGNSFTVQLTGVGTEPVHLSLTDLAGKQCWTAVQVQDGTVQVTLDLPAGVYLLRMQQNGQSAVVRMMKE